MLDKFRQQGYPAAFAPLLIGSAVTVLFTGLALVPQLLTFQWEWDISWTPSGLVRLLLTTSHVLGGFFLIALVGAVWLVHARAGWLRQERHISGSGLLLSIMMLTITAPLLLYASHETSLTWIATLHAVIGGLLPIILLRHVFLRKRRG